MKFAATCLFGLEKLLGEEITELGYNRMETIDGRVIFEADVEDIPRLNINLRYAERVYIIMGEFNASSFTELFDETAKLPWEDFIGEKDVFPVTGHSIKSTLTSIPDCQSIIKKAIVKRLTSVYRVSWFEEIGILYKVEFFMLKDRTWLMIDTSGAPLHKRGYRTESNAAPIRETLAAALATIARPREDVLFWDPMCGSGTIPIEAALLMSNTAPGINRHFAAESFPQIDADWWREAFEEAHDNIKTDCCFEAYASDISEDCVRITRDNIARAGMGRYIKAFQRDALSIVTGGRRGTVVCNPPYGERLMTEEETFRLYRDMGRHFKTLDSWQIYIISSADNFEALYGRRADKVRKLYNGMIRCSYYQYFKGNIKSGAKNSGFNCKIN
ncbi:MAG: class I SAM-dependent RNA methyltransferase [Ruminococcaceae bacterium]|nr:class I SAM-dependent RNA methyltransferase [Oscillospiraceae bacterium]